MGVAQLERLLRHQNPPPPPPPLPPHPCFPHDGFAHYGFPVLRGSGQGIRPTTDVLELSSMPNIHHANSLSYKKKRVIGDEVGFMRSEKEKFGCADHQINFGSNGCHFPGFDHHHHHHDHHHHPVNGFLAYNYNHGSSGSEVVAIHKKGNGSGNVMMEYGFFPGISDQNDQEYNYKHKITENNNNNYEIGDLKLKMGLSDCSPSSSYSSTVTVTNSSATAKTTLDLSLKLSY